MILFSFSNLVMLLSAGELQCRNVFGYPFKTGRITRFFSLSPRSFQGTQVLISFSFSNMDMLLSAGELQY